MPSATVTNRTIKNSDTGIDVSIPSQQVVSGRFTKSLVYEVVVITNLDSFKCSKHSPEDTVQFMIPKTFADFEKLLSSLEAQFTGTVFPPLPKKSVFLNNITLKQSRSKLEEFIKFLACKSKFTGSETFLEFLGSTRGNERKLENVTEAKKSKPKVMKSNIFDDYDPNEAGLFDDDLKGDKQDAAADSDDVLLSGMSVTTDLTDSAADVDLFARQDLGDRVDRDDEIILPSARLDVDKIREVRVTDEEQREEHDLLDIVDDLSKFDVIERAPRKTDVSRRDVTSHPKDTVTRVTTHHVTSDDLSSNDISAYIQQQLADDDVDLFS